MKRLILITVLSFITVVAFCQSTNDIMVGGGLDIIKTDNPGVFERAQVGLEANYFVVRHFAVGLGAEIWTDQKSSFMMGARWYANDNVFVRFRGLIGANDASLGAGYAKPLTEYLRIEGMGDFYFASTEFGIRVGLNYVIKRN
ncbi:MAG TPA: hypothetical protein PKJ63_04155 [Cyclobacteriaceae bacterium]|nr:hypothetical protein [Cyclobacteriaceae bacterium]HRW97880.1 hypothetical protein [Cyclobacteriaceae bacterium]